ncbi:hypothetical protein McanMca71_003212 [Microsporum canis]
MQGSESEMVRTYPGEEKPACLNCKRQGDKCDYSIRLNWEGRSKKRAIAENTRLDNESIPPPLSPSTPNSGNDRASGSPISAVNHIFMPIQQYQSQVNKISPGQDGVSTGRFESPIMTTNNVQYLPPSGTSAQTRTTADQAWLPYSPGSNPDTPQGYSTPLLQHQKISPSENNQVIPSSSSTRHVGPPSLMSTSLPSHGFLTNNIPMFLSPSVTTKGSPGSSASDETFLQFSSTSTTGDVNAFSDMHRVSVDSLLSHAIPPGPDPNHVRDYGLDRGEPDLDVHRDIEFLASLRDHSIRDVDSARIIPCYTGSSGTTTPSSSPEGMPMENQRNVTTVFSRGGYYAKPVPIYISRFLSPLPPTLLDSPINMLYFHHFINHTARILVPHDCFMNPFATVLPSMAIEDENILNLLLTYSASHRARLLGHAEPYTRIARWTSSVFPSLRHALNDQNKKTSAATLATAIMLVSLKVISPTTFEVPIRWESHLMTAREIFLARQKADPSHFTGQVNSFLHRWLVYLDLFGSLSSRRAEPPLFNGTYWPLDTPAGKGQDMVLDKELEIDCFMGFTPRCCSLLSRLSVLTHQCDNVRVDPAGRLFTSWHPPAHVLDRAEKLLQDMEAANPVRTRGRRIHHHKPVEPGMAAVDEAYRLAGMIHLHRRVFGRKASDPIVRGLVDALFETLNQVSRGGQEEVCVLFPLFTAGCESQDVGQRQQVSERVQGFESVGMKQIRGARKLMQRSWREALPWNVLADGEFLA